MATRLFLTAVVEIEAKDEWEGDYVQVADINTADVASHMQDWLNDTSKQEYSVPWRILSVSAQGVRFQ